MSYYPEQDTAACDACGHMTLGDLFHCRLCEKYWCKEECSDATQCTECNFWACDECTATGEMTECGTCMSTTCGDCMHMIECASCGQLTCYHCVADSSDMNSPGNSTCIACFTD